VFASCSNPPGTANFLAVVRQMVPDSHILVCKSGPSCQRLLPCAGLSIRDDESKNIRVGRTLQQIPTNPTQLAAYIFNLLSSGNTQSAATAIAQAATQGSSGATAIATALATASSQVCTSVTADHSKQACI